MRIDLKKVVIVEFIWLVALSGLSFYSDFYIELITIFLLSFYGKCIFYYVFKDDNKPKQKIEGEK